ncbi:MAG: hypothetical protein HY399_05130 [Elusimicrobia bacterium]|nr:hypothetical protein [Elusimicrobiota bacterium]
MHVLLLLFCLTGVQAQQNFSKPIVRSIQIERLNVFDPAVSGEDWWIFKLANKIHIKTKPHVIERELLLKSGSVWDPLKAEESERNLRQFSFLKNARLLAQENQKGVLNLAVRTQDTWTLEPQILFSIEGGEKSYSAGILERNLLGLGKEISLFHDQTGGERRNEARFFDPRLYGTWVRSYALYNETDTGHEKQFLVERPFYSLSTLSAFQIRYARLTKEDNLFQWAHTISSFQQAHELFRTQFGFKVNKDPTFPHRLEGGYWYQRDRFDASLTTTAGSLPQGRKWSAPFLSYSWVQAEYLKDNFIDKAERLEDFNLGNEARFLIGYAGESLGSDRERILYEARQHQGIPLGPGRFLLLEGGATGRVREKKLENALYFGSLNVYWKLPTVFPQTWVWHVEGAYGKHLDGENQLILGGDNGLRGYKVLSFTGNKSILMNVEGRIFHPKEVLALTYVGAAVFFDAGTVASPGQPLLWKDIKSDVGIGFRLGPTRSASGTVARMDLAYALKGNPAGGSRWVVSIISGHAFGSDTNTVRHLLLGAATDIRDESITTRFKKR